jgi:poly [ADP-ribose] polymerase
MEEECKSAHLSESGPRLAMAKDPTNEPKQSKKRNTTRSNNMSSPTKKTKTAQLSPITVLSSLNSQTPQKSSGVSIIVTPTKSFPSISSSLKNTALDATSAYEHVKDLESELEPKTRELLEVLFSKDMRDETLASFKLNFKKIPDGIPSRQHIQNGVLILNAIEDKLNGARVPDSFYELSSQFYIAIPQSFKLRRPPLIMNQDLLQEYYRMCNILLDISSTAEVIRHVEAQKLRKLMSHSTDLLYRTLKADLSLVDTTSQEYTIIRKYFDETKSTGSLARLLDVWTVDRHGESQRYKKYDHLENRRLLWYGANIATVAQTISSGLRIMPHGGGRAGNGIYLTSMQEKSAQDTSEYKGKLGCMFLCEGALGKSYSVTSDDHHVSSLKKAPEGFDSVHVVGTITPKFWTSINIDGRSVEVPETKAHLSGIDSAFRHDEFLVYDESQVRIRYIVTVNF